jgi:hypothetical protein
MYGEWACMENGRFAPASPQDPWSQMSEGANLATVWPARNWPGRRLFAPEGIAPGGDFFAPQGSAPGRRRFAPQESARMATVRSP